MNGTLTHVFVMRSSGFTIVNSPFGTSEMSENAIILNMKGKSRLTQNKTLLPHEYSRSTGVFRTLFLTYELPWLWHSLQLYPSRQFKHIPPEHIFPFMCLLISYWMNERIKSFINFLDCINYNRISIIYHSEF